MTGYRIRLNEKAHDVVVKIETRTEELMADGGEFEHMRDWAGKFTGSIIRIAGLLHMADHADHPEPWGLQITESTMHRAAEIGKYLKDHAKIAYEQFGTDSVMEDAKSIQQWIIAEETPSFSARDALQGLHGQVRFKRMEPINAALRILVDRNVIRKLPSGNTGRPGRPKGPVYEVNPALFTSG